MPSFASWPSLRRWASTLLLAALAPAAWPAAEAPEIYRFGAITITEPIARATPPGAKTGVVYFTVDNASNDAERLVRASTPVAAGVQMHQTVQKGGMMTMRAVPSLEIGPGGSLELGPSGYHLMLIDLRQPLKVGERFPLTLTFQHLGTVTATVTVGEMGAVPRRRR